MSGKKSHRPTVFNAHLAVKDCSADDELVEWRHDGGFDFNDGLDPLGKVTLHGPIVVIHIGRNKFRLSLASVMDRCTELVKRKKQK